MSKYLGDIVEDATIRGVFNSRTAAGTPITLAGTPSLEVYKDANTTQSTTGVTLTVDFDARTGLHLFTVDTSSDAFYVPGSDYRVCLAAGTVDGVSVVGVCVSSFSIENRNNKANVVQISGDSVAADNAESFFDGTGYAGTGNVIPTVSDVTTKTGYSLSAGGVQAIWDALTSALTTVGSIGKLFVDNINATIGSRSTYAGGDTAGTTTLLSRIASALTIISGKVTVGTNDDKTGYALSIAPPTLAQIEASTVLAKEATVSTVPSLVWSELTTATWPANSFGKQVVIGSSTQRSLSITGSNHVASVLHDAEPNSIPEDAFITGALSARALAADAATEIATAVSGIQILSRLDSMVESNGSGQFRFDTIALELAPAGGGGSSDWTANERTAIRSILGIPASGTTPTDPIIGILDSIRDQLPTNFAAMEIDTDGKVLLQPTQVGVTIPTVTNLTNAPTVGDLTAAMKASINTEVGTALADIHLDHLLAADYNPASKPGVATALLNELIESDAGVSRYTANALEQGPSGGGGGGTVNITVEDSSITIG